MSDPRGDPSFLSHIIDLFKSFAGGDGSKFFAGDGTFKLPGGGGGLPGLTFVLAGNGEDSLLNGDTITPFSEGVVAGAVYLAVVTISSGTSGTKAIFSGNPLAAPPVNTIVHAMQRTVADDMQLAIRSNAGETLDVKWYVWRGA